MKDISRTIKISLAIILGLMALLGGGRVWVFWQLEKRIDRHFQSLQLDGISVRYKSMEVNSWKASVRIIDLKINYVAGDTACAPSLTIPEFYVEGLSVFPLLLGKSLSLKSVYFKSPSFRYPNNFTMASKVKGRKKFMNELEIGHLIIESGTLQIRDSVTCGYKMKANLDFVMNQLTIHNLRHDSMTWSAAEVAATAIAVDLPTHFYKINIKRVAYSRGDQSLRMDSMRLEPTLGRLAFAKKTGYQTDQFVCVLPQLIANGFVMGPLYEPSFSAQHVAMNFQVTVFRDRRMARARVKPGVLPTRFLSLLPYRLHIDSIRVSPSYISYEEYPEIGDATGKIFFNNLQANIYNVSNDSTKDAYMNVTSRFMNAGDLHAKFMFPLGSNKPYTVSGSLSKFSMAEINGMLMSIGNVKIESGTMNEMKFQFHYNDSRSDGQLEVNHSNLKVLSLRNDPHQTTNKFFSFLIRTFIKKDIDQSDAIDKRIGQIRWERDSQRGILNYWWKSVLSGIRDVYKLDKLAGNKEKAKAKS